MVADATDSGAACQLEGIVTDCCCSYAAVERLNKDEIQPILKELVATPFFRYFKVDLYCECPLWPEDGMCSLRDCSVCECDPEEVPEPWRAVEGLTCDTVQRESDVDRSLQPGMKSKLISVRDWKGYKNPWMHNDDSVDYSYINLMANPEKYTGYKGEHANRVWQAIYEQEALRDVDAPGTPHEKRFFYKLISGLHSSISAHLCAKHLIDEATDTWGSNLYEFKRRLGNPYVRDRIENLYFAYLFVLRAVGKAQPILKDCVLETGSEEDARAMTLLRGLVDNEALQKTCPVPFDEGRLWRGGDADELRQVLQNSFQNITRIMDCVGCEKCKMWGKLQLLGIATSLKILFSTDDCGGHQGDVTALTLERNELIALINLLERLATSVEIVRTLSLELAAEQGHGQVPSFGAIEDVTHQPLAPQLQA